MGELTPEEEKRLLDGDTEMVDLTDGSVNQSNIQTQLTPNATSTPTSKSGVSGSETSTTLSVNKGCKKFRC